MARKVWWGPNDTLAYRSITDAAERARKLIEEREAGKAYKEGAKQDTTEVMSGEESLQSFRDSYNPENFGPNAPATADEYIAQRPDIFTEGLQKRAAGKEYALGVGDNRRVQEEPFTPTQQRAAGLMAAANTYYGRGKVLEGAQMEAAGQSLEKGENELTTQRRTLKIQRSMDDQFENHTKVLKEIDTYRDAVASGKMTPEEALAKLAPHYNANVNDGMFMQPLPNGQVAFGKNAASTPAQVVSAQDAWAHVSDSKNIRDHLTQSLYRNLAETSRDPAVLSKWYENKLKAKDIDNHGKYMLEVFPEVHRLNRQSQENIASENRLSHERVARISSGAAYGRLADERQIRDDVGAVNKHFGPQLTSAREALDAAVESGDDKKIRQATVRFNALNTEYNSALSAAMKTPFQVRGLQLPTEPKATADKPTTFEIRTPQGTVIKGVYGSKEHREAARIYDKVGYQKLIEDEANERINGKASSSLSTPGPQGQQAPATPAAPAQGLSQTPVRSTTGTTYGPFTPWSYVAEGMRQNDPAAFAHARDRLANPGPININPPPEIADLLELDERNRSGRFPNR